MTKLIYNTFGFKKKIISNNLQYKPNKNFIKLTEFIIILKKMFGTYGNILINENKTFQCFYNLNLMIKMLIRNIVRNSKIYNLIPVILSFNTLSIIIFIHTYNFDMQYLLKSVQNVSKKNWYKIIHFFMLDKIVEIKYKSFKFISNNSSIFILILLNMFGHFFNTLFSFSFMTNIFKIIIIQTKKLKSKIRVNHLLKIFRYSMIKNNIKYQNIWMFKGYVFKSKISIPEKFIRFQDKPKILLLENQALLSFCTTIASNSLNHISSNCNEIKKFQNLLLNNQPDLILSDGTNESHISFIKKILKIKYVLICSKSDYSTLIHSINIEKTYNPQIYLVNYKSKPLKSLNVLSDTLISLILIETTGFSKYINLIISIKDPIYDKSKIVAIKNLIVLIYSFIKDSRFCTFSYNWIFRHSLETSLKFTQNTNFNIQSLFKTNLNIFHHIDTKLSQNKNNSYTTNQYLASNTNQNKKVNSYFVLLSFLVIFLNKDFSFNFIL